MLFFVYPVVNEHLGYFYLWDIMGNAAINNFVWTHVFIVLCIYLGMEWLGHAVVLYLIIWETVSLSAKAVVPFYIPTSNQSIGVIINSYFIWPFDSSHATECQVISHCVFFIFLMTNDVMRLSRVYWSFVHFPWRNVYFIFCPF